MLSGDFLHAGMENIKLEFGGATYRTAQSFQEQSPIIGHSEAVRFPAVEISLDKMSL